MCFCHRQAPQNVSKKGEGLHASEQSNLTRARQGFRATWDGAAWGEAGSMVHTAWEWLPHTYARKPRKEGLLMVWSEITAQPRTLGWGRGHEGLT